MRFLLVGKHRHILVFSLKLLLSVFFGNMPATVPCRQASTDFHPVSGDCPFSLPVGRLCEESFFSSTNAPPPLVVFALHSYKVVPSSLPCHGVPPCRLIGKDKTIFFSGSAFFFFPISWSLAPPVPPLKNSLWDGSCFFLLKFQAESSFSLARQS